MYLKIVKPIIDFIAAFIAFIIALPIFIILTVLLLITNNGKPFFIQKRPGKEGKIFHIIKFKTMNDNKAADGVLLADSERLTFIGRLVRKTSLDEIPQLLNVLKGDMSLVGPRPLLPEYLPLYNENQATRHNVKPGITGWAQINGRNTITWEEKLAYDAWYVQNVNFVLDVKIILMTIKKVLISEGVSADGSTTVGRFKENE